MIRLVKVKQEFYSLCQEHNVDEELLFNEAGRPCVLLIRMNYKNNVHDFVVPLRSNISARTPRNQYFALPPNSSTRPQCRHGIHYFKLFPIKREYIDSYIVNDEYHTRLLEIINRNKRQIIAACQDYLKQCESGNKHFITERQSWKLPDLSVQMKTTNAPQLKIN